MGLFDKYAARYAAKAPDYEAVVTEKLGDTDRCLAWCLAMPTAYRQTSSGRDLTSHLLQSAVAVVGNAVSSSRNITGEEGSIARSLDREGGMTVLVIGERAITWWETGPFGHDEPELTQRVAREHIVSIADTGRKAQGGVPILSIAFADGSSFNYSAMSKPGEDFWGVARGYGRG